MKKFLFISLLAMMTISARAQYTNYGLFNGGHQDAPFGLVLGYVNKGWSTDFGSYTWHENLWGEKDKKLPYFPINERTEEQGLRCRMAVRLKGLMRS